MTAQDAFFMIGAMALFAIILFGFWRSTKIPPRNGGPDSGHNPPPSNPGPQLNSLIAEG